VSEEQKKLLPGERGPAALRLADVTTMGSGVIVATYEPARLAPHGSYELEDG
jgi:hypothetical protein